MFCWPLFVEVSPDSGIGHTSDAPLLFVAVLPFLVAIVLAAFTEDGMDSKALAMLGVLSAVNAALRPLGAGIAGIETVFFVLVLAGMDRAGRWSPAAARDRSCRDSDVGRLRGPRLVPLRVLDEPVVLAVCHRF
jgi:hypothetical protein